MFIACAHNQMQVPLGGGKASSLAVLFTALSSVPRIGPDSYKLLNIYLWNKWMNVWLSGWTWPLRKIMKECPSSLGRIHSPQITAPISMCRLVICWCMHTFSLNIDTSSSNSFQLKVLLPTLTGCTFHLHPTKVVF